MNIIEKKLKWIRRILSIDTVLLKIRKAKKSKLTTPMTDGQ